MEANEYKMSDAVNSRERDVNLLFMTADGETAGFSRELDALGVDVSGDQDEVNESARQALYNYALDVSAKTVLTVTLGIGGPTAYMSAVIGQDTHGCWVREESVTFFDSWAVPQETRLPDDSALTRLFDEYVETYQPES